MRGRQAILVGSLAGIGGVRLRADQVDLVEDSLQLGQRDVTRLLVEQRRVAVVRGTTVGDVDDERCFRARIAPKERRSRREVPRDELGDVGRNRREGICGREERADICVFYVSQ